MAAVVPDRAAARLARQLKVQLAAGESYEARETAEALWRRGAPRGAPAAQSAAKTVRAAAKALIDAGEHKFAGSLCAVLATEGPQEARDAVEEELVELCEALWVQARKVGPANAVFEDLANAVLRAAEARLSCERLRAMTTVLQLEKDRGAYARSMRKCAHLGMWRVVVQATAFEVGRNGDADDDRHCCVDLFACRAALLYLGGGGPPAHVDRLLTSLSEMLQLDGIPGADEAESSPLAHFAKLFALAVERTDGKSACALVETYSPALQRDPALLACAKRILHLVAPPTRQEGAGGQMNPLAAMMQSMMGALNNME